MTVSTVAGQVAETVNVCIDGQGPFPFVLDSGAGQSTIDAGLADRLHLPVTGPPTQFEGVGCTGRSGRSASGSWSLEGVSPRPSGLTAARMPQLGGKGEPVGLLGSDVLSRFGAVRLDLPPEAAGAGRVQKARRPAPGPPIAGPRRPAAADVSDRRRAGTTVPVTVAHGPR